MGARAQRLEAVHAGAEQAGRRHVGSRCCAALRNFLAKYPESNGLQKRMLIVSEELARRSILDASAEVRQAQQNLWRAQGNDVDWHGVFGGIYFPHLRADAYASPLKSERILSSRRH